MNFKIKAFILIEQIIKLKGLKKTRLCKGEGRQNTLRLMTEIMKENRN